MKNSLYLKLQLRLFTYLGSQYLTTLKSLCAESNHYIYSGSKTKVCPAKLYLFCAEKFISGAMVTEKKQNGR